MVVHMSQVLYFPVASILELRSIHCLLQTRPTRRVFGYFTILLSSYTYKGHHGPLKICLWTLGVHGFPVGNHWCGS